MASKQYHELGPEYDLIEGRDKAITVQQAYGNLSAAKAAVPRWSERLHATMPQAQAEAALMADAKVTAAYMNAYVQGHAHAINAPKLSSSCVIQLPWGEFWTTRELPIPIGAVRGRGVSWSGTSQASTVLSPWHEQWKGDPAFRNTMVSQVRGVSGNSGYLENCYVDGINFEGRCDYAGKQWHDPSYESYGIYMAGAGEANRVGMQLGIRGAHHNNAAFAWAAATPGEIGYITVFKNCVAGVEVLSGALSTMDIGVLTGDENAYLVRCSRGATGDEGAMLNVRTTKLEGGTNPESVLQWPHKGQMLLELLGQGGVNFGLVQVATTYYVLHALVKVHPSISAYGPQNMSVKIGMFKQNRNGRRAFERSFIDTLNKKSWDIPGIFDCETDLKYDSDNGGRVTLDGVALAEAAYPLTDRLGHIVHTDTRPFDVVNGNPRFYFTGPPTWGTTPPPPTGCTWIPGTPVLGPCANNSQTVTTPFISSVAGCTPSTPKPADVVTSQACGTTPPPTGSTIATIPTPPATGLSVTSVSFSEAVNWVNAKTIQLDGFKLSSAIIGTASYYLCGSGNRGIVFKSDGGIYDNRTGTNVQLAPPGTTSTTVAKNITLTLPSPWTLTFRGAIPTAGNGLRFTCTKMIVKK